MNDLQVTKHSTFHYTVYSEIIINAPKEKVWEALTNFEEMPKWSKALQKIEPKLQSGTTTVYYIFQEKLRKITHQIIGFEEGTQFGWSDTLIPFSKDNHLYRLEALPDGRTKFIQSDAVKGFSTLFISGMMLAEFKKTFPAFNHALKDYVENKM